MDENLLPSDNSGSAAADQAVSESMDVLQKTSSLLERIHAQREREAAKAAAAATSATAGSSSSSNEVSNNTAASSVTNKQVTNTIEQQTAPTTTTSNTTTGGTTETIITNDVNNINNATTVSSDNDVEMNMNNTNFNSINNSGGGGLQVPNYSPIANDAVFSGTTTTTRREMTNSGFGFSMNFDNMIPNFAAAAGNGYNPLLTINTSHDSFDQSSEALLSENVASLSNQYSMSAYFKMMILDIYSLFRAMPVPIQIITILVLFLML